MSSSAHKTEERDGKTIHFSVGALIENEQREILLVDRINPPPGLAGPAGHQDEGEHPTTSLQREVLEETGLTVTRFQLLISEFVDWNVCGQGVKGHHWYLFRAEVEGEIVPQYEEVESVKYYPASDLASLPLEEVWRHWFEKLNYIT